MTKVDPSERENGMRIHDRMHLPWVRRRFPARHMCPSTGLRTYDMKWRHMSAQLQDQFDLDIRVATPGSVAAPDSLSLLLCTRVTCRSCTCFSCITQCIFGCV